MTHPNDPNNTAEQEQPPIDAEVVEGATTSGDEPEQQQAAAPKKEYVTKHGDCKGFANDSDNPRAPSANMMMRITKTGLQAWLARLEAANVEEGDIEYVMFSKTGARSDGKGDYCFMNLMESRPQAGQEQVATV